MDYRICHCWVKDKNEMISMNIDNIIFDNGKILPNPIFIKNKMDEFDVFYQDCEEKILKYINTIKVEYPMFDVSISRIKNEIKIFVRDSVNKIVLYTTLIAELSYDNKSVLIREGSFSSVRYNGINCLKSFFDRINNNQDYYFKRYQHEEEIRRKNAWFNRVAVQVKQFENVTHTWVNNYSKYYNNGILITLKNSSQIGVFFHLHNIDFCVKEYRGFWHTIHKINYDSIYDVNIIDVLEKHFSTELTGGDVNV